MIHRHSGPITTALSLAFVGLLSLKAVAQETSPAPEPPAAVSPATPEPQTQPPVAMPPALPPSAPEAQSAAPAVQAPATGRAPAGVSAESEATPPSAPAEPIQSQPPASEPPPVTTMEGLTNQFESMLPQMQSVSRENLPHDLSPIGMFLAADWVVKGVMISLAFASLVTWTVWVAKTMQLAGARMRAASGIRAIGSAHSLDAAFKAIGRRGGPVSAMVRSADRELRLSGGAIDFAGADGVKERVASSLHRIEVQAGRQMSVGTGVLATIGSTAPFVGLFGTVWGIMNSFIGISESQTTNLAVVAPGIAEALLATAIGLVAAIPAVIIYNVFARSVSGYRQSLADAAAGVERLVSRDLDYRKVPVEQRNEKLNLAAE